jgi:hypothetical protein
LPIIIFSDQSIKNTRKKRTKTKKFLGYFYAKTMPTKKRPGAPPVLLRFSEPPDPSAYNYMIIDQTINRQEKKTKN